MIISPYSKMSLSGGLEFPNLSTQFKITQIWVKEQPSMKRKRPDRIKAKKWELWPVFIFLLFRIFLELFSFFGELVKRREET